MEETKKKLNPARFLREVRYEVGKVVWPTRKETVVSSAMVLVMVAIAGVFFLAVDSIISYVIRLILGMGA